MNKKYVGLDIVGSDETGVGDFLTPLVACATYVTKENVSKLEKLGVTDSKKLSSKQITFIANEIKKFIPYKVTMLSQKGYNILTKNGLNANELKMLLHMKAINHLEERFNSKIDLIVIDQFANENSTKKYIDKLDSSNLDGNKFSHRYETIVRGEEEHVAVAAASIIGRAHFLDLIKSQNKKWNMIFPLGTNDIVVQVAKEFVRNFGESKLNEVAKLSFKTIDKVITKGTNA